jgi:opacity protein-like surface antigen
MRKWLMSGVLACAVAAGAQAQDVDHMGVRKGAIEMGVAGGISAPFGDYGDVAKLSGTGAIILGYYTSPRFAIGLDIGVHLHGPTDEARAAQAAALGQADADLKLKLYRMITPYVKFQFKEDKFSPYVTGLAGLYMQQVSWTQNTVGGNVSQDVWRGFVGVAGGLGVQYNSDESVAIFLDARVHTAMRSDFSPLTFVDARIGVAFLL